MKWPLLLTGIVILVDLWRIAAPLVTVSTVDVPNMWKEMSRIAPSSPDFRVMTVPDEVIWQAGLTYTHHLIFYFNNCKKTLLIKGSNISN